MVSWNKNVIACLLGLALSPASTSATECKVNSVRFWGEICGALREAQELVPERSVEDFDVFVLGEVAYSCRHLELLAEKRRMMFRSASGGPDEQTLKTFLAELRYARTIPIGVIDASRVALHMKLMSRTDAIALVAIGGTLAQVELPAGREVSTTLVFRLLDLCANGDLIIPVLKNMEVSDETIEATDSFSYSDPEVVEIFRLNKEDLQAALSSRRLYRDRHTDIFYE